MPPRVDREGNNPARVRTVTEDEVSNMSVNGLKGANYGSQFSGGTWKAARTNTFITAVSDPANYLRLRSAAINVINDKLDDEFKSKYAKWLTQGVPPEDALRRSEAYIMKISQALYEDLDAEYPEDIQQTAANLSYSKSHAAQNGFDPSAFKKGKK